MAIVVFFVLRFVPFLGLLGSIGFPVLLVAVPIWSVIWLSKYRGIETDDAEFLKARSTVKKIGIIVAAVLAVVVALNILALQLIHPRP